MRRIALHGGYFDDNFGDLLLLALFARWIEGVPGDAAPGAGAAPARAAFPLVPRGQRERFARHLPGARTGRRHLLLADGLVYAGGGHFGEPGAGGAHAYGTAWAERFLARHVPPARAFGLRRRPWLVAGVGAGPLSDPRVREAARRILAGATEVSVRDEPSRRFLVEDLDVGREVLVHPDPALALAWGDVPAAATGAARARLDGLAPGPRLGIHHPRDWLLDAPGARAARQALHEALARERDVAAFVFSDNADRESAPRLAAGIEAASGRTCAHAPFEDAWTTAATVGLLDAVLTTKLHVGIVAWALGVEVRAFAIHPKVPRFHAQVGREDRCTMLDAVTPEIARHAIDAAIEAARRRAADVGAGPRAAGPGDAAGVGTEGGTVAGTERARLRAAALGNARLVARFLAGLDGARGPGAPDR